MNYRILGNSDLKVSEICFGVMTFTGNEGWTHLGTLDQKDADDLTAVAIDNGVNFFDTADVYSNGISETMLGKALGMKRKNVVIATKGEGHMWNGADGEGHSRAHLIRACEDSLKRLNTDCIDLYQVHSFDFTTPLEEMMEILDTLIKDGKIRYAGISNFFAWQIMKLQAIADKNNLSKITSLQAYYSIIGRDLEYEQIPLCIDQGIGIIVWSPLHGGILTGKYRNALKWPEGTRLKSPGEHLPYNVEKGKLILDKLEEIALNRKVTMSQAALNYTLSKPGITSVIAGARNKIQLLDNINASGWKLSSEEMKVLDDISAPARIYPYWYFDIFKKDKMQKYFDNMFKKGNNDGI
jgi:aryl-alcohol dehydrogenase-like predicted oxidoreductase